MGWLHLGEPFTPLDVGREGRGARCQRGLSTPGAVPGAGDAVAKKQGGGDLAKPTFCRRTGCRYGSSNG